MATRDAVLQIVRAHTGDCEVELRAVGEGGARLAAQLRGVRTEVGELKRLVTQLLAQRRRRKAKKKTPQPQAQARKTPEAKDDER